MINPEKITSIQIQLGTMQSSTLPYLITFPFTCTVAVFYKDRGGWSGYRFIGLCFYVMTDFPFWFFNYRYFKINNFNSLWLFNRNKNKSGARNQNAWKRKLQQRWDLFALLSLSLSLSLSLYLSISISISIFLALSISLSPLSLSLSLSVSLLVILVWTVVNYFSHCLRYTVLPRSLDSWQLSNYRK